MGWIIHKIRAERSELDKSVQYINKLMKSDGFEMINCNVGWSGKTDSEISNFNKSSCSKESVSYSDRRPYWDGKKLTCREILFIPN